MHHKPRELLVNCKVQSVEKYDLINWSFVFIHIDLREHIGNLSSLKHNACNKIYLGNSRNVCNVSTSLDTPPVKSMHYTAYSSNM